MLKIDNINTFYGETQALFGVSLDVQEGECVALLGQNGAGKTTTIRSVLGLTAPKTGSVHFDGTEITRLPTHKISRLGISWVPDDRRVFPTLTVARNLQLAQRTTRFRSWSFKDCFEIFTALEYLTERECENLSGGEMQMVAISRALLGAPGLILFDEPSQGLAPKVVQDVLRTIRRIKTEGIASLVVEQNAEVALSISDRVYVMAKGEVVYQGPSEELRQDHKTRKELLGV